MKLAKFFSGVILILAFIFNMLVIMPSGSKYCVNDQCGVFFWGAHEHDSVWHLAVESTLFKKFPFEMPNMSGAAIHGYNYLLDIVVASLAFITRINISTIFFKILPVAWFGVFSLLIYKFAKIYRNNKTFPILTWLFVFFGSSFSYVLRYRNVGSLWGASSILSMQPLQNMLNPQFAWSLIPLLTMLIGIGRGKRETHDFLKYGLLTGIAMGLKFYTGSIMLVIVAMEILMTIMQSPKMFYSQVIKGLIVAGITAASIMIFYNPGHGTGFPFIFKPLATVNPIIEDSSLLYLPKWALRLYDYRGIKLGILELFVLGAFIILNFGTRILGMLGLLIHDKASNQRVRMLLFSAMTVSLLMAILFIQRGVWWNTVQFLYVSLFLGGILAAEGLDIFIQKNKKYGYVICTLVVILTIPTNIDVMHTFAKFPGTAYISSTEIEALDKLKEMPEGVILTPPFNQRTQKGEVNELARTYDTAYIAAYTGKQTYLSDLIQLELTNISYRERSQMFARYDCQVLEQVKYIYEYTDSLYVNEFSGCGKATRKIFENQDVSVYQVE